MGRLFLMILVSVLVLGLAPAHGEPISGSDEQVRAIAEPILDNILKAFRTGDYQQYSRDLDDMVKETVTEAKFPSVRQQVLQQLGNYRSREYLGSLTKGKMTMVLWKGDFDGTTDDVLLKVVLSKLGHRHLVTGLWFQ